MKRVLLFLSVILLSVACKKSRLDTTTIRYEFTSDVPATYQLDYATSNRTTSAQVFKGAVWSHNVIVSTHFLTDSFTITQLTAYPPSTWANTTISAHVNLRISVNGEEKISKDTLLNGASDRINITYTF